MARVVGLAFNYAASPDEMSLAGSLCAYDDGRVVGTSRTIAMDQWFGGGRVPCAGVAGVTVLPEFRGRGVAGAMMRLLLDRRRQNGDAVSTLYPANAQLYRRLGYEMAGLRPEFRAPLGDLPASHTGPPGSEVPGSEVRKSEVREMVDGDLVDVMACYTRYAAGHNGLVKPTDPVRWTDHVLAHSGEGSQQRTVVVAGEAGLDGYASYFLESGKRGSYGVHCKHLVALTPEAFGALLGHFRRFENAASELIWHGPPSTGAVGLALASTGFSIIASLQRWMLRVLDVPRALEARGYQASGEVVIAVDDPLFPANSGPWHLRVDHGRATVTPAGIGGGTDGRGPATTPKPLAIGLLSALYTSLATPADLVLMGALDADDDRLASLAALFAGPAPWMPDSF
jgi:predicted acetyltransferase